MKFVGYIIEYYSQDGTIQRFTTQALNQEWLDTMKKPWANYKNGRLISIWMKFI